MSPGTEREAISVYIQLLDLASKCSDLGVESRHITSTIAIACTVSIGTCWCSSTVVHFIAILLSVWVLSVVWCCGGRGVVAVGSGLSWIGRISSWVVRQSQKIEKLENVVGDMVVVQDALEIVVATSDAWATATALGLVKGTC